MKKSPKIPRCGSYFEVGTGEDDWEWLICKGKLRELFDVDARAEAIQFVFTKKPTANSVRARLANSGVIEFEDGTSVFLCDYTFTPWRELCDYTFTPWRELIDYDGRKMRSKWFNMTVYQWV